MSSDDAWLEPVQEALDGIVKEVFHEDLLLTRWVTVLETVDARGQKVLHLWYGPEVATKWDRQGMLFSALHDDAGWEDGPDGDDGG